MARLTTSDFSTSIPGGYGTFKVAQGVGGLSATGVLMLVGEATMGPDFTLESDLEDNAFGPDQEGDVVAKYGSGPLVDAFRAAVVPANDARIVGAPTRIVMLKTNVSAKADGDLTATDSSVYRVVADKSYGKSGNLIAISVESARAEVVPTTGSFTYIPAVGTVAYAIRVSGGAAVGGTLSANTSPVTFVSTVNALTGVAATGGANLSVHPASGTITFDKTGGNFVTITTSVALGAIPSAGDTLVIPDGSVVEGVSNENVGAYIVISASANEINVLKLSDAGKPGATAGTITGPADVSVVSLSGTPANDLKAYGKVTISYESAAIVDGVGKSLEIAQLTSGTDLLERTAYETALNDDDEAVAVDWVSKASSATILSSAAEYKAQLNISRQFDSISQELAAGGEIGLKIGYDGTTAALTIDDDTLAIDIAGGSGADLSLTLSDFATIADLVAYVNTKTGYTAAAGTAALGVLPPSALDNVSTGCASEHGALTGRIKVDAYKFFKKVSEEATIVQLQNADGDVEQAAKGLPVVASTTFLSGGSLGGTTAAQVTAALEALERVRGNFLVTCFSRDASEDIVDGITDSSSTYEIDAVNLGARTHVLKMSTIKARKNRQFFGSKQTDFESAKDAAGNLATYRGAMAFQDLRDLGSDGLVHQFPPWLLAAKTAGGQAAAFYRNLTRKSLNAAGVLQEAGDFDDRTDTQVEDALDAGLLVVRRDDAGGLYWVDDRTTQPGEDPILTSIANVYIADTITLTAAQRMERAFVGESASDVNAAIALSFLEAIFTDFLRLKLLAPSDDAPKGFKNAKVQIGNGAMLVSAEIKLNGAIKFIAINFLVALPTSSAG